MPSSRKRTLSWSKRQNVVIQSSTLRQDCPVREDRVVQEDNQVWLFEDSVKRPNQLGELKRVGQRICE